MSEFVPPEGKLSDYEIAIELAMLLGDYDKPVAELDEFGAAKEALFSGLDAAMQRRGLLTPEDFKTIDDLVDAASESFLATVKTALSEENRIILAGRLVHETAAALQAFGAKYDRGDIVDPGTLQDCIDGVITVLDFSDPETYDYNLALSLHRYLRFPIELLLDEDY